MSNQINPDATLVMTIDDLMEIFIVISYLKITGDGIKREPSLYTVDVDYCVGKLQMVAERIRERNLVPK